MQSTRLAPRGPSGDHSPDPDWTDSLTNAPSAGPSAAEQTTAARVGAVLFRNRGWLPVPFLLIPLLLSSGPLTREHILAGVMLMSLGEAWRLWGVATAGTVTRRRSRNVQTLVAHGPFAWSRNPLYVGNFLIWMGVIALSGVRWFLPIAVALFALEYYYIVRYEEGVLESIFGKPYLDYKARTPRWIPRPPAGGSGGEFRWAEAWKSEISTFLQYIAIIGLLVWKSRLG
ncbi:MAG: isoprenylcysteine carboxylmethyltransferase family protein [Gemmatimonadota bacterium]|nr:isoprenylcysteine carboxylmethyltransferase family protein [Gemmatimonadota bacterium]MDQ8146304.1 isoprenylcysteine carboxylmethyltransferase family protein [Gemmatimonadota bacterium]MDQ8148240.1 isoprenylcysteine carboxylmethyltransferase family protein [Gemmatimonadota bacterium]MDQ8155812.1 isoprenylcysteine carboxylmethyltransferase family protein [Gemmatimonadota bacterium]MDQ8175777.1 isoprenylcysteine carboxylmethyltransferase family protein [Gemmatimonadota bacterium]